MSRKIAFIGLGKMGNPMAANLARAGYQVTGFDLSPEALQEARDNGVTPVDTVTEAVTGVDIAITMLPNGHLVDSVVTEILSVNTDVLIIDSSTIAVDEARAIDQKVRAVGARYIDAPVSGGMVGATNGTLAFMVGGTPENVADAAAALDVMGRATTHCGGVGAGQAAKVCNNMILGVHQLVLAEAIALAEGLDLDLKALYEVVSNSTGASWALTSNCPVPGIVETSPANNGFKPGFATSLMVKDLNLAMDAVAKTNTDAALGRLATEKFTAFNEDGGAHLDFSAIVQAIRASVNA